MKRSTDNRKSISELRFDTNRHYGAYIRDNKKYPSRINPIFTEKPHYGLEGKK